MAATASAPNGDVPQFKIVERLDGVPAIHDSVAYANHLVNSTQITQSLYQTALGLVARSYDIAQPVITRTKPLLESADGLAVATFDRAEATFPYPFKTPTGDLIVVKQGKAVYDARIAPFLQQAQPVLQDVLHKTAEINSALGARAHAVVQQSSDISHALLEQLRQLAEQGKGIPATLLDRVGKASGDVKEIVVSKETTLQEKSNKLGAYVVDQLKPVVDEIYNYVIGAKKKTEAEAQKVGDEAKKRANGMNGQ